MADGFHLTHSISFDPADPSTALRQLPDSAGVLLLRGRSAGDQPYLTKAANLRRRATRLLEPAAGQTRRLNLRDRIGSVEYTLTGSDFESLLCLYQAHVALFSVAEARKRLRLFVPYCVRFAADNPLPRAYVSNRLAKKALSTTYGPFASRAAAERYCDAVLDLFRIRRCWEDLECHPDHPGCVYGEMKKCMAPCQLKATAAEYAAEAARVQTFFESNGETLLSSIAAEREAASADMEFEKAAEAHQRWQKVNAAASLSSEIVHPIPDLHAVILQPCGTGEIAVFLVRAGFIHGPEKFSTLGIRAARLQEETGSSLFAQPLMLQPVALEGEPGVSGPEDRMKELLAGMESAARPSSDMALLGDHMAMLKRWYYRPEKSRSGRIFFPQTSSQSDAQPHTQSQIWPWRRLLNAAAAIASSSTIKTD